MAVLDMVSRFLAGGKTAGARPINPDGTDSDDGLPAVDVGRLFDRLDRLRLRRAKTVRDWKEAIAYFVGEQWISFQAATAYIGQFTDLPVSRTGSTRVVLNKYQRNSLAIVGLLTSGKPIPETVPVSSNSSDVEAARGTNLLLRHLWQLCVVQDAIEDVVSWAVQAGNGFWKIYWDHDAGKMVPNPALAPYAIDDATGIATHNETGERVPAELLGEPNVPEGQLCVDSVSPFCVFWDDKVPFAKSMWLIQHSVEDADVLEERFGVQLKPDAWPEDLQHGGVVRFDVQRKGADATGVETMEFWHKPCRKYPEGMHLIAAKQRKEPLYQGTWEQGRPWPIIHFGFTKVPGSPLFLSPMKAYIPAQQLTNRLYSNIADHITTAGNPSVMGTDRQFQGQNWSPGPGKILKYTHDPDAPQVPVVIDLTPQPEWVMKFLEQLDTEGQRVSGVSDAFVGATDGEDSGRAISYKVERTSRNFANAAGRLVQCLYDVGIAMLELWRVHGPAQQTIRVMGADGQAAFLDFTRDQISYATLHMDESSVLVGSRIALVEMAQTWLQYGAISPEEFRQFATMPGLSLQSMDIWADDKAWARRNIVVLKNGGPAPFQVFYENHSVHYEEWATWMKSPEFFNLDPNIQATATAYLQDLYDTIQQSQQQPPPQNGGDANGASGGAQPASPTPPGGGSPGGATSSAAAPSPLQPQVGAPGQGGPGNVPGAESAQKARMA